jgi:hypothetical protein
MYLYANSITQREGVKKINKKIVIEDLFHLPLVSTTQVVHLELRIQYLREFS